MTTLILQKVSLLRGLLDPDWVDGNPGQPGPILRAAMADYAVAEVARDIGQSLSNAELGAKLVITGRELAQEASRHMVSSYDEGDDICPPWRHPIPPPPDPWRFYGISPSPDPWKALTPALNDLVLATALRELASLTTSAKASALMKEIGETVVKGAASRVYDEHCGTLVKPRIPGPRREATAA
jgi:hypothetical protein